MQRLIDALMAPIAATLILVGELRGMALEDE